MAGEISQITASRKTALLSVLLATFALALTTACHRTEEQPGPTALPPAQESLPDHRAKVHALAEGAPPAEAEGAPPAKAEAQTPSDESGNAAFGQAARDELDRWKREQGIGDEPEPQD